MDNTPPAPRGHREMKVLSLGLPRTATLSMAEALTMLGYHNVFHSLRVANVEDYHPFFDRAANACFPSLNPDGGKPAADDGHDMLPWHEVFGDSEAATEVAAMFAPQLIRAYPDAKVVLVVRDFEGWYQSLDETLLRGLWSPLANFFASYVQPLIGSSSIAVTRKIAFGFFEARTVNDIRKNARIVYDRHHEQIISMVPPDQLLMYKMGDGWGPLCEFLGKPVPKEEFPWVNESEELKVKTGKMLKSQLFEASKVVFMPKFFLNAASHVLRQN